MDTSQNHTRALLIDVDNCANQIRELPDKLTEYSRIVACFGGNDPKVHLSMVPILASAINEGRLEIVEMERKGENAADFGLAFWAGRLVAEMPPETEFLILSQDYDLDYVVDMLRCAGRKVTRINGKPEPAKPPAALVQKKATKSEESASNGSNVEKYFTTFIQPDINRPTRKESLSNSIKSFFRGKKGVKPENILRGLIKQGIISIDDQGRVSYP